MAGAPAPRSSFAFLRAFATVRAGNAITREYRKNRSLLLRFVQLPSRKQQAVSQPFRGAVFVMRRRLTFLPHRTEPSATEYGLVAIALALAIGISLHGFAGKIVAVLAWMIGAAR